MLYKGRRIQYIYFDPQMSGATGVANPMDDEKKSIDETEAEEILWEQMALILEEHFHAIKLHTVNGKKPLGHL